MNRKKRVKLKDKQDVMRAGYVLSSSDFLRWTGDLTTMFREMKLERLKRMKELAGKC